MEIKTKLLKPGMILDRDVYYSGNSFVPLLTRGTILDEATIKNLGDKGIDKVNVNILNETVSKELQETTAESVKNLNFNESKENAKEIIYRILKEKNFVYGLDKYQLISESEFNHAVNVCSFAVALTKSYNEDNATIDSDTLDYEAVALTALFHNIGLIFEKKEQFNKLAPIFLDKQTFTKFDNNCFNVFNKDMINVYAYSMLNNTFGINFPPSVKTAILIQNERNDGSGILGRKKSFGSDKKIEKIAKIVHLCDIYDEVLKLCIKEHQTPSNAIEALDYFKENGEIDSLFTDLLKEKIPLYSKGLDVKLSNGVISKIIKYNPIKPTQPLVMINPTDNNISIMEIEDSSETPIMEEKDKLKNSLNSHAFSEIQTCIKGLIKEMHKMDSGKDLEMQKHSVNINNYYSHNISNNDHIVNICFMAICLAKKYNETIIDQNKENNIDNSSNYLDYKRIANLVLAQNIASIMDNGKKVFEITRQSENINQTNLNIFEYTTKENEIISLCDLYEIMLTNCAENNLPIGSINKFMNMICMNNDFSTTTIDLLKEYLPLFNVGDDVKLSNGMEATILKYNQENPEESLVMCDLVSVNNVTISDICNYNDIYGPLYKKLEESIK